MPGELTYGQVRQWKSTDLEAAYRLLDHERRELLGISDELTATIQPAQWIGDAASSARYRLHDLANRIEQTVAEIAAAKQAIGTAADDLSGLTRLVAETEHFAKVNGLTISFTGKVSEREFNLSDLNFADRRRKKAETTEQVERVMRLARELDDYLTSVFSRILASKISDGGATTLAAADRAGGIEGSLHTYLLAKYQVSIDPKGMVNYPDGVVAWVLARAGHQPQSVTKGEALLLEDLGLAGLKDAYDIYKTSIHQGETIYQGQGKRDGHSDAFRHAYWNAMLANRFGQDWTEQYTTAHERVGTNAATAEAMDLHNNEVGRRIAAENPDSGPEELKCLVDQAVRNGEMVVVGPDGALMRSNDVPMGETILATDPRGQGGHDPGDPTGEGNSSGGYNPQSDGENYGTYDN
jgi:hypothetical protein